MADPNKSPENACDVINVLETNFAQNCRASEDEINSDELQVLPSAVLDRDFIYHPPEFQDFEGLQDWQTSGKWLVFAQGDTGKLDRYWCRLRALVDEGILLCLKSSTGTDTEKGVLMCYTSSSEDRCEAKRAADAIREATMDDAILFYKTNQATDQGKYQAQGSKLISKYMHTVACSLYERDQYRRWTKVLPPVGDALLTHSNE